MKKLLIYDLDGTLVDTAEDIARAVNFMLSELKAPALSKEEVGRYVGRGLHQLIQSCLGRNDPALVERGAKIYKKFYGEHMLDHSALYPGAEKFLRFFKERIQAVITNKPNPYAAEMLKALGVGDYFTEVIAGNSGYPKKPDPSAIFSLIKTQGIEPREAVMIGDSPYDIETARNAGIEIVAVTHGFSDRTALEAPAPDGIVNNFEELFQWANSQAW